MFLKFIFMHFSDMQCNFSINYNHSLGVDVQCQAWATNIWRILDFGFSFDLFWFGIFIVYFRNFNVLLDVSNVYWPMLDICWSQNSKVWMKYSFYDLPINNTLVIFWHLNLKKKNNCYSLSSFCISFQKSAPYLSSIYVSFR